MLTRRRVLQLTAMSALAVLGGAAARWHHLLRSTAERGAERLWSPAQRLRVHFDYLDLDPAAVDEYIEQYERVIGRLPRLGWWPDDVYVRFLMSTDFFANGADESRRVRFRMLYEPYQSVCYNPLARFD